MKKTLRKLNNTGASLAEMLVTVLIMSLVTLAIAAGVTAAVRVYRQISLKAEAQTLLGTSVAALNNDFAFADMSNVQADADYGETVAFYSNDRGYDVTLKNNDKKGIMVTDQIPLVTGKTMTLGLRTKISEIHYYKNAHYFTYKITVTSSDNHMYEEKTVAVNNIAGQE